MLLGRKLFVKQKYWTHDPNPCDNMQTKEDKASAMKEGIVSKGVTCVRLTIPVSKNTMGKKQVDRDQICYKA